MKLKTKNSIQQQISDFQKSKNTSSAVFYEGVGWAIGPKKPTEEMIERAKFVDKTYIWHHN